SVVHAEWSSPELAEALSNNAAFSIIGGGADGVWYVDVDGAEGRASRLPLRAGVEAVTAVDAHHLDSGVTLTADDIEHEAIILQGPPTRSAAEAQAGWVTRRRIARGEPLVAPAVAVPDAVKPGDDVRIVYVSGPVELVLVGRVAGSG